MKAIIWIIFSFLNFTYARAESIRFAWSGDLGGQNVCRDEKQGYPIFKQIENVKPDFFIGLGDMIYADGLCKPIGRYGNKQIPGNFTKSFDKKNFKAHWRYNFTEKNFKSLLNKTEYYTLWDDHEIVNDFGPKDQTRKHPKTNKPTKLMDIGWEAYKAFNQDVANKGQSKSYFKLSKGEHLELFFLDNRKFRDHNEKEDDIKNPKTMLGQEQLSWFKQAVVESSATWKIIVSSVPISIPTGRANRRDGWANYKDKTGFELELKSILDYFKQKQVKNMIWITTDVHFATGFEYDLGDDYKFHEFVVGPLSAHFYPNKNMDSTFNPKRLYFYAPEKEPTSFNEAVKWFNFGFIEIDELGKLSVNIINGEGKSVFKKTLPAIKNKKFSKK